MVRGICGYPTDAPDHEREKIKIKRCMGLHLSNLYYVCTTHTHTQRGKMLIMHAILTFFTSQLLSHWHPWSGFSLLLFTFTDYHWFMVVAYWKTTIGWVPSFFILLIDSYKPQQKGLSNMLSQTLLGSSTISESNIL